MMQKKSRKHAIITVVIIIIPVLFVSFFLASVNEERVKDSSIDYIQLDEINAKYSTGDFITIPLTFSESSIRWTYWKLNITDAQMASEMQLDRVVMLNGNHNVIRYKSFRAWVTGSGSVENYAFFYQNSWYISNSYAGIPETLENPAYWGPNNSVVLAYILNIAE